MKRHRWTAAAAVIAVAGMAAALAGHGRLGSRQAYVIVDPAVVIVLFAGLLAAGIVLITAVQRRVTSRRVRAVAAEQERASDDRRRFLLRLDHELKNPLQAIRVGLAVASPKEGSAGPDVSPGPLGGAGAVDVQVVRITRLLTDLRKLAELEVHPLEAEPLDLGELLEEVADAAADLPGADSRSLRTVITQAPWPLPPVTGDRDLLFVAVHNLLANAVKYSDPGDTIELRAREDGDVVVVEVADTGAGIPADEQDLVWEELARGRGSRTLPGSGLGLSLVRVVITRHGGTTAMSSRPGEGTVVAVRLPTTTSRPTPPPPTEAPGGDVAGLRHRRDSPATRAS